MVNEVVACKCPLCGSMAQKSGRDGWSRYCCPKHDIFDITESEEAMIRADPSGALASGHVYRIERQRKSGTEIPKIGVILNVAALALHRSD